MGKQIRWGILGCGGIAKSFSNDIEYVDNGRLVGAGSRTLSKAEDFIENHGGEIAFGSYEELVKCEEIDAVYISTPHAMHFENAMLCIEHGKGVLCEKPFTLNAQQSKSLVKSARDNKVFIMEGMWTRFIPATRKVKDLIIEGEIGEVRNFTADFSVKFDFDPNYRAFNADLGGGALLDLGVYLVAFSSFLFECKPKEISSVVNMGSTGVDFNESFSFLYDSGAVANFSCGMEADSAVRATISGTEGIIEIASPFFHSKEVTLKRKDGEKLFDLNFSGRGYHFEIQHAGACMLDGKSESDVMMLDESIDIMETMDDIRRQWGLVYPQEK